MTFYDETMKHLLRDEDYPPDQLMSFDAEVPLLTQKLVGFRVWRAGVDGTLSPRLARLPAWEAGVNKAVCKRGLVKRHPEWLGCGKTPNHWRRCHCGLYAYRNLKTLLRMEVPEYTPGAQVFAWSRPVPSGGDGWVLGAVVAWGDVQVHDDGFRSELMAAVALTHHPKASETAVAYAEQTARKRGLRYVQFDELEEFAAGYGTLLPEQLRPRHEKLKRLRELQAQQARIAAEIQKFSPR